MKTTRFFLIIAAFLFTAVSCVENSQKYKAAVAERDSLATEKHFWIPVTTRLLPSSTILKPDLPK